MSSVQSAGVLARGRLAGSKVALYLLPIIGLYAAGLALPLLATLQQSYELGLAGWLDLFRNPLLSHAVRNTIVYSALITVIATVFAYSVAAAIWRCGPTGRIILTSIVLISFWTTVMVKIIAWQGLLGNSGVVNLTLSAIGVTSGPVRLVPGAMATVLGMIQFVLPFAVFPILSVMLRLDRHLERAAESLGASPFRSFRHVVLPLTLPGALAAALLVFVICTGFFIIPEALGSPRDAMIANLVSIYAMELVDFRVASAIAVLLVVVVMALTVFYQHLDRKLH